MWAGAWGACRLSSHVIVFSYSLAVPSAQSSQNPACLAQPACSVWVERGQAGPGPDPSSVTDQLCGLERSLALSEPPFQHL